MRARRKRGKEQRNLQLQTMRRDRRTLRRCCFVEIILQVSSLERRIFGDWKRDGSVIKVEVIWSAIRSSGLGRGLLFPVLVRLRNIDTEDVMYVYDVQHFAWRYYILLRTVWKEIWSRSKFIQRSPLSTL